MASTPVASFTIKVAKLITPVPPSATPFFSFDTKAPAVPVTFFRNDADPQAIIASTFGAKSPVRIQAGEAWVQPWVQADPPLSSWFHLQASELKWGTTSGDTAAVADQVTALPAIGVGIASAQASTSIPTTPNPSDNSTASTGIPASTDPSTMPTGRPSSSPASASGNSKGSSAGVVAGAAIGCLIAGALIAGLIFWFCWGKRKASRVRDYEASSTALMPREKGFATSAVPLGSGISGASPVTAALPLPLEDKAITSDISKISNSIKNHVQSYYQMGRVSPGLIDLDDINALGSSPPISAGTLSTLLDNPKTREIAMRFCIASVVCSRMLPGSESRTSLLPVEVAGCFQKMTNKNRGSPGQTPSELTRWRVTTAELMQGSYVRDPFTASDGRNGSVQAAANTLDNILRPFADSRMENGERRRNLEEILKRAALFAFTLFSQPSTWDFDWQAQGVKSGELCIFPALVQLSNETGQAINPPLPFSEAVVRRLDE